MALRDEVLKEILNIRGEATLSRLPTHSIIFIEEIVQALEKIYYYLVQPLFSVFIDETTRSLYCETGDEHTLKLSVDQKSLVTLQRIFKEKRVKIGAVGPYSIYFDREAEQKIFIDTRVARVMGDPIQLNLHLYPNTLEIINWLETIGYVQGRDNLITNKMNGALTVLLDSGKEILIETTHPYYETLLSLANNQQIEIGTELSDKVSFTLATGLFHRSSDGTSISPLDFEKQIIINRNQAALDVIQIISQYTSAKIDKRTDPPNIILLHGKHPERIITPDDSHYEIFFKIVNKQFVQVGVIAGKDCVMFTLESGFMIMNRDRVSHLDFNAVKDTYPALLRASNGLKLFKNDTDPNVISAVHPGGKLEIIRNSHILFSFYNKLLNGLLAYTYLPNRENSAYLISYTENGLSVTSVSAEELQKRLRSGRERFFKLDLQPKQLPEESVVIPTKETPDRKNEKHQPVKMVRRKERSRSIFLTR